MKLSAGRESARNNATRRRSGRRAHARRGPEGRPRPLPRRELRIELITAACFAVAAVAMAVLLPASQALDWPLAAGLVAAYAVAARVRFHTGSFWTVPTQLIFVPMLFLLPTNAVPLLIPIALILSRLPDYVGRRVHPSRALIMVGDSWYAIGPALILVLASAEVPTWGYSGPFFRAFARSKRILWPALLDFCMSITWWEMSAGMRWTNG